MVADEMQRKEMELEALELSKVPKQPLTVEVADGILGECVVEDGISEDILFTGVEDNTGQEILLSFAEPM